MVNQVILVGRLCSNPEFIELENGKKRGNINLAVPRPYKNSDGAYETDFIRCSLWNNIASNVAEYCKKGDVISIKGRIQTGSYEDKEGKKQFSMEIVADKVSFITSRNMSKNNNERDER